MKKEQDSFHLFLLVLYGLTLLGLITAALMIEKGQAVYWINGHHNSLLDKFFFVFTYLGDGLVFLPPLIALLFVRYRFALIAACAWVAHGVISHILKRWVFGDFPRPGAVLDHTLLYFVPGVQVHDHFSFPSGHTTTIFCLAMLLSLVSGSRLFSLTMLVIALLVGYSRIYLLQHFLMDVAGGAVVGTLTTVVCWNIFQRYGHAPWLDRRLKKSS